MATPELKEMVEQVRTAAQEKVANMELLLEVARREQGKTGVELQQLRLSAEGEKRRAVEGVELSKKQVRMRIRMGMRMRVGMGMRMSVRVLVL